MRFTNDAFSARLIDGVGLDELQEPIDYENLPEDTCFEGVFDRQYQQLFRALGAERIHFRTFPTMDPVETLHFASRMEAMDYVLALLEPCYIVVGNPVLYRALWLRLYGTAPYSIDFLLSQSKKVIRPHQAVLDFEARKILIDAVHPIGPQTSCLQVERTVVPWKAPEPTPTVALATDLPSTLSIRALKDWLSDPLLFYRRHQLCIYEPLPPKVRALQHCLRAQQVDEAFLAEHQWQYLKVQLHNILQALPPVLSSAPVSVAWEGLTLTGRIQHITEDGCLVQLKYGQPPSRKKIEMGEDPTLPLLSLGAPRPITQLAYWHVKGYGEHPVEVVTYPMSVVEPCLAHVQEKIRCRTS